MGSDVTAPDSGFVVGGGIFDSIERGPGSKAARCARVASTTIVRGCRGCDLASAIIGPVGRSIVAAAVSLLPLFSTLWRWFGCQ